MHLFCTVIGSPIACAPNAPLNSPSRAPAAVPREPLVERPPGLRSPASAPLNDSLSTGSISIWTAVAHLGSLIRLADNDDLAASETTATGSATSFEGSALETRRWRGEGDVREHDGDLGGLENLNHEGQRRWTASEVDAAKRGSAPPGTWARISQRGPLSQGTFQAPVCSTVVSGILHSIL